MLVIKKNKKKYYLFYITKMSYLAQNYFNNFQVRNPILKNPVNRNPPVQLTKIRPSQLASSATNYLSPEDINASCLSVTNVASVSPSGPSYNLPSATDLINWLGVQSNGLPTPTYSSAVVTGDLLIVPVVNNSPSGVRFVAGNSTGGLWSGAGNESTGIVFVPGKQSTSQGGLNFLVIDFTNVSAGSQGVTGSYTLYGNGTGCTMYA
jgi:hypothetical protein